MLAIQYSISCIVYGSSVLSLFLLCIHIFNDFKPHLTSLQQESCLLFEACGLIPLTLVRLRQQVPAGDIDVVYFELLQWRLVANSDPTNSLCHTYIQVVTFHLLSCHNAAKQSTLQLNIKQMISNMTQQEQACTEQVLQTIIIKVVYCL